MSKKLIPQTERAYIAGLIDAHANIRTRKLPSETLLADIAIYGPHLPMLNYLSHMTGTKVVTVKRKYDRHPCLEHCQEGHQHIVSESGRWSLTGARAMVVLSAIRPYVKFQAKEIDDALRATSDTDFKPATLAKMRELGWPIPKR